MDVEQDATGSRVNLHPVASLNIGTNALRSDASTSSIKNLSGKVMSYDQGTFSGALVSDTLTTAELIVDGDTILASGNVVEIAGHVSIEGTSSLAFVELKKEGSGAALVYDKGGNTVALGSSNVVSGTLSLDYNYFTAHSNPGYPQVDFEGFTAVSGTIDYLQLNNAIDVPSATITDIYADGAVIGAATISDLTSNFANLNNRVGFNQAQVIYASGTTFQSYWNSELFSAYAVTASGYGDNTSYMLGAGSLGPAAELYPGVELQEKFPDPTQPTNFRI